jgi:hypothetical protein
VTTRRFFASAVLAVGALGASCSNSSSLSPEIDRFLCTQEDVGPGYIELSRGEFTPADLAELAPGASTAQYKAAGMRDRHFVFWKQALPKPPFEPPMNVLCQVIEFETEEQAVAYASGTDGSGAPWAGIAWFAEGNLDVESAGESLQRVSFQEAGQSVSVLVGSETSGSFFYSVYLGTSGTAPEESALRTIQRAVAARR